MHDIPRSDPGLQRGLATPARIRLVTLTLFMMLLCADSARGQGTPIERLRAFFFESVEDETAIEAANVYLASLPGVDAPEIQAYAAIFEVMRARHAFWPVRKMHHLNAGLPVLDTLVTEHADHLEIRYLRLMACYYLPRFLGRGWSVDADLLALAELLPGAARAYPVRLYRDMVRFVVDSDVVSEEQRRGLRNALAASERAGGVAPGPATGGY
jgi:hypothetical protein